MPGIGFDLERRDRRRPEQLAHRFVGPEWIVGITGVSETSAAAEAQQFLHFLDRPADHAARLAGLELTLNLDKGSVGAVETLRKDRGIRPMPPTHEPAPGRSSPT